MKTELTNEDFHLVVLQEAGAKVTVEVPEQFRNLRVAVIIAPIPDINEDRKYLLNGVFRGDYTEGWRSLIHEDSDRPDWEVESDHQWEDWEV